jgi:hypothetical protein
MSIFPFPSLGESGRVISDFCILATLVYSSEEQGVLRAVSVIKVVYITFQNLKRLG